MKSLLLESLHILLLSNQVLCSVWPNNQPKYTDSYLPPAVQILHVQTERLNDIGAAAAAATSTTTEAITTTSAPAVTCRPQTEGSVDECQTYSGPPEEAAPVELIDELDGGLNANATTTPLPISETIYNVTVTVIPGFNQTVTDQLADDLSHDSEEGEKEGVDEETVGEGEGEEEEEEEGGGGEDEEVIRVTALTNERESNSTSNKEEEKTSDILAAVLALERLRDILTADVKRQGLSKVQGYSEELLETLAISSTYSSRNQLRIVLIRMLKRGDAERRDSILMTKKIIEKLKDPEGLLSSALQLVPPLMFTYQN